MKKKVFLFSILIVLILIPLVLAANETYDNTETGKIDKAYDCLKEKVQDECSSLSAEEKVFSLLVLGECKNNVKDDSKYKDNVKYSAQALLAMDKTGSSTSELEEWLIEQNTTTSDNLIWYLQIDSNDQSKCSINYDGSSYTIDLGEDKKIDSNAGSCLSLAQDDYWLEVASNCYEEEFEISCNESFSTNLLYKKKTASTIYISSDTHSASAEARTKEKVNSFCFEQGGSCNYEASLWATIVLNHLNYDTSSYLPYLVAMADEPENIEYLSESFLYFLTGSKDFRSSLLEKQKPAGYWMQSSEKYYDTAVALHPLSGNSNEESNAKEWLLEVQGDDGCWNNGNIRDTAFLLYSGWPETISVTSGVVSTLDCETSGYYCMSSVNCEENVMEEYSCAGSFICCDESEAEQLCRDLRGEICNSNQNCIGGDKEDADDISIGEVCCVGGTCQDVEEDETECEDKGGDCRSFCLDDEEEGDYDCDGGDTCCVTKPEQKSYFWIWMFAILIILVVLGIIFRNKLRLLWFRIKSKFTKSKKPGPRSPPGRKPRFGFPPPRMHARRPMPRKILPPTSRRPLPKQPVKSKPAGEIDDVLKKLKDMGK